MKRLLAVGLLLAIAGCAGNSNGPPKAEYAPKPRADADKAMMTRAQLHTELAANYYGIGNYAVALQEADEALKADPDYVAAYSVLGLIYAALHDDRSAEDSFQRALRIDAGDPDANNNYGWFLCQRKREQEGIKYFLTALRNPLYQTPEKAWLNAGICARQIGDLTSAQDYFSQVLKARPAEPQVLYYMADMAYKRGDFAGAKSYLAHLPSDPASSPEVLWLALRVERKLGDQASETSYGFQLRKNFPNSPEAQALRAGRYE